MLQAAEWSIDAGCWESIVAGVDLLTLGCPVLLDLFYCLSCYH